MRYGNKQDSPDSHFWPIARISISVVCFLAIVISTLTYNYFNSFESTQRFSVQNLLNSGEKQSLVVFTQFDLQFSAAVTEAINNGVPIYINIEYGKPINSVLRQTYERQGLFQHRIERHALSNRYLLNDLEKNKLISFESIDAALSYLGQSYKIPLASKVDRNDIAVRCYVDLKQLPSPLRLKRIFSRDWSHDSGWSVWPLS